MFLFDFWLLILLQRHNVVNDDGKGRGDGDNDEGHGQHPQPATSNCLWRGTGSNGEGFFLVLKMYPLS